MSYPDSLIDEILIVQLVFLRNVMFGELSQLNEFGHDLLFLIRVGQIDKKCHNAVRHILPWNELYYFQALTSTFKF